MPVRVVARVPPALIRRGRVLRPADAHGIYAHPRPEFQRLERAGALHRLADGHYAVVPDDRVGQDWLPDLESVALGIAAPADASTAPRSWGSAPPECTARSPARSTSRHRRPLQLTDLNAQVLFVRRDVAALDLQRHHNELGEGWITTVEQTLLDLIARPQLGGVPDSARDAITALIPRVPLMLATGGAIVNTASVAAFRARPGFAAYTTSKAAVAMLTRQAALEYADDGIRVNGVAPGLIDTPLVGDLTPAIRAETAARIPLGRLGTPEEVAALVTFLLTGAASYITGQIYLIDGGSYT